jgi:hypothetical protein
MPLDLTPERGLLFRITHISNVSWLLTHGLHAASGDMKDPGFIAIGNPDLIAGRTRHAVSHPPGGTLADYVPFYFTPKSPMLYNIRTGYKGITRRSNDEIAVLLSSCWTMAENRVRLLFTDRHAYMRTATWTSDPANLAELLDWQILRRHDFARDDAYPDKMDRYQAEALAHRHVPPAALLGIGCASESVREMIESAVLEAGVNIQVFVRPGWYF